MSNTDILVTTIALVVQAALITMLAIQNARLKRAIHMRDYVVKHYLRNNHDISDWSR